MKINWSVYNPNSNDVLHTSYIEPENAYKSIIKNRHKETIFLKCPAVQDFYKNVFVYRSPVDLTLRVQEDGYITVDDRDQQFFNRYVLPRTKEDDKFVNLSLNFQIVFYTECDDVIIQQFSALMEDNEFTRNTRVISGEFNIGKWIRPIEVAFEVCSFNNEKIIHIKRGDALCYFRFLTNEKITMERTIIDQTMYESMSSFVNLKFFRANYTLKQNYEIMKSHMNVLRKRMFGSKCPFSRYWR